MNPPTDPSGGSSRDFEERQRAIQEEPSG